MEFFDDGQIFTGERIEMGVCKGENYMKWEQGKELRIKGVCIKTHRGYRFIKLPLVLLCIPYCNKQIAIWSRIGEALNVLLAVLALNFVV